jgi:hypothetical protein
MIVISPKNVSSGDPDAELAGSLTGIAACGKAGKTGRVAASQRDFCGMEIVW